jgi:hypothetical protein
MTEETIDLQRKTIEMEKQISDLKDSSKPSTQNTLLYGWGGPGNPFKTCIAPLSTFHVLNYGDFVKLVIEFPPAFIEEKKKSGEFKDGLVVYDFMFSVCDDPYQDWVGDWMHLGCFRALYIFRSGVLSLNDELQQILKKQVVTITGRRINTNGWGQITKNFERDLILSDRKL